MHIYIDVSEHLSIICYKRQSSIEVNYLTVSNMTNFSSSVLWYLLFSCTTIKGEVCVCVHFYINVHINHSCIYRCHWMYI